jgi:uncharacterized protein
LEHTATFWAVAAACGLLVGLSKTGIPGVGILVVPLMAVLFPAKASVGSLLPMLICGDMLAMAYYRRHGRWRVLAGLVPWILAGAAAAVALLSRMDDRLVGRVLGGLVLAMLVIEAGRQHLGWDHVPRHPAFTACAGLLIGFSTTAGNAAGPVINMYLISRSLQKEEFVGTAAWLTLIMNTCKAPVFHALGMITADSLRFDGLMIPFVLAGGVAGRWLLTRIPQKIFEDVVLALAAVAALRLLLG